MTFFYMFNNNFLKNLVLEINFLKSLKTRKNGPQSIHSNTALALTFKDDIFLHIFRGA